MKLTLKKGFAPIVLVAFLLLFVFADSSAEAQRITIVRDDKEYPPYEFMLEGRLTGLHVELVNYAAAELGIEVEWVQAPWTRALRMVELGQVHGITYIGRTEERAQWATFLPDNVISSATFSFVAHKDVVASIGYTGDVAEALKDRSLVVVRGFYLPAVVSSLEPTLYEVDDQLNLGRMIAGRRYELALMNASDFLEGVVGASFGDQLTLLEPPVHIVANYVAFSKVLDPDQSLANAFAKVLQEFKQTEAYQALLARFTE